MAASLFIKLCAPSRTSLTPYKSGESIRRATSPGPRAGRPAARPGSARAPCSWASSP